MRAYAICAVEDDPAKDPVLTAKLTRYMRSGRGPNGDGKIDYPIKLTGVMVSMTPHTVYLSEMKDVKPVLRFKNLTAY